jgi:hypothetical protein
MHGFHMMLLSGTSSAALTSNSFNSANVTLFIPYTVELYTAG